MVKFDTIRNELFEFLRTHLVRLSVEKVATKEAEATTAPAKQGVRRSTRIAAKKDKAAPITDPNLSAFFTVHL